MEMGIKVKVKMKDEDAKRIIDRAVANQKKLRVPTKPNPNKKK